MPEETTTIANGTSTTVKRSAWMQGEKPFWFPDAQAFLMFSMILICAVSIFYRMTHPSEVNDKILDMMITISFSTCLVLIYNFAFGSSSSGAKIGDTQNRIVEKLTSAPPAGGPVAPVPSPPVAPQPFWNRMTDAERAAITAEGPNDPKIAAFLAGPVTEKPNPDDLAYLVTKGLLTQERATALQS